MKFTTKIKGTAFVTVKSGFVSRDNKLLIKLLPIGSTLLHYKGIRRGSLLKGFLFGNICTFKTIIYDTQKKKLYYNDILSKGTFLKIKFWSHRHKITDKGDFIEITDNIEFTTKSKKLDSVLAPMIWCHFTLRRIKLKLFFLLQN